MEEALPDLKERTELDTLYTDGGYGSPDADQTLLDHEVELIQTAIRGRIPDRMKLNLPDFEIKQSETEKPAEITCPQGYSTVVKASSQKKGFVAYFDQEICQNCLLLEKCSVRQGKRDAKWYLRFNQDQVNSSQRRRGSLHHQKEGHNLRAAVESAVWEVKHSFPAGKLPVRGSFRVTCMVIGSAMMTNVRRIQRCLLVKKKQENEQNQASKGQNCLQNSLFLFSFLQKVNFRNWIVFSVNIDLISIFELVLLQ